MIESGEEGDCIGAGYAGKVSGKGDEEQQQQRTVLQSGLG